MPTLISQNPCFLSQARPVHRTTRWLGETRSLPISRQRKRSARQRAGRWRRVTRRPAFGSSLGASRAMCTVSRRTQCNRALRPNQAPLGHVVRDRTRAGSARCSLPDKMCTPRPSRPSVWLVVMAARVVTESSEVSTTTAAAVSRSQFDLGRFTGPLPTFRSGKTNTCPSLEKWGQTRMP